MTRALVLLCMAIILPLVRCHKVRSQPSIAKTPKDTVIPCNYLFKTKTMRVRERARARARARERKRIIPLN